MRVFTWLSDNAPEGHKALARIMLDDGSWHPVLISGPTEHAAGETATNWWRDELAKANVKRGRKPKATVEDPGDVV